MAQVPQNPAPDDLSQLESLDKDSILRALTERYYQNKIYTYIGDVTIAFNPWRKLWIYDENHHDRYVGMGMRTDEDPHIFWVADKAYRRLRQTQTKQTILVGGESGAGKTENTKLLIQHLAHICKAEHEDITVKIVEVNPLLEAFGNACTPLNENSSRFGKFVDLRFTSDGNLLGAEIFYYLLEKTRIAHRRKDDRNFHYFHYFLSGIPTDKRHIFGLDEAESYKILHYSDEKFIYCAKDAENFQKVESIMDAIQLTFEDRSLILAITGAILHLTNIAFTDDPEDFSDGTLLTSRNHLSHASRLLHVDEAALESALTVDRLERVGRGTDVLRRRRMAEAEDCRDALARALYERLFSWLVGRVNQHLQQDELAQATESIGILDMAGFESFPDNGLEQLLINVANERLQFYFNEHLFSQEQKDLETGGIDWSKIPYENNIEILDLFMGNMMTRFMGMLALIDEMARTPGANDLSLVTRFSRELGTNDHYMPSQYGDTCTFSIIHFAGEVTYNAQGFLEKNRDTLSQSLVSVVNRSSIALIASMFQENPKPRFPCTRPKRKQTVVKYFKNSLSELMERLSSSQPLFVRCIRPNLERIPNKVDSDLVSVQMEYNGLLELAKIRKIGYPVRMTLDTFTDRYELLIRNHSLHFEQMQVSPKCETILQSAKITDAEVGKEKVFMKEWHRDFLDSQLELLHRKASVIQKQYKTFRQRQNQLGSKPMFSTTASSSVTSSQITRSTDVRRGWASTVSVDTGLGEETDTGAPHRPHTSGVAPDEEILPADSWNIFRLIPAERMTGGDTFTGVLRFIKALLYLLMLCLCLGGLVVSKVCTVLLTTTYDGWQEAPQGSNWTRWRNTIVTFLLLCIAVPKGLVFVIQIFKGLFGSQPWPSFRFLLPTVMMETLQTIALCVLVFLILPKLDMIRATLLLSAVCFVPALLRILAGEPPRRNTPTEQSLTSLAQDKRQKWRLLRMQYRTKVIAWRVFTILAALAQLGALVMTGHSSHIREHYNSSHVVNVTTSSIVHQGWMAKYNVTNTVYGTGDTSFLYRWLVPIVLLLLSTIWWENPVDKDVRIISSKLTIQLQQWKLAVHCHRHKSSIISSLWGIALVFAYPYIMIDSFSLDVFIPNVNRKSAPMIMGVMAPAIGQIGGAILAYACSVLACKLNMQTFCFALPLLLSTPISVLSILLQAQYDYIPHPGHVYAYVWSVPVEFVATPWHFASYLQFGFLGVAWLSAMVIAGYIWFPLQNPMDKTEKLFVTPLYNGVLLEQDLLMNRRRRDDDLGYTRMSDSESVHDTLETSTTLSGHTYEQPGKVADPPSDDTPTVYACATMWHENKQEMTQLMKSLFRVDKDQSRRRNLMQVDVGFKDPDYFHFESHIWFDDALALNDQDQLVPNQFVQHLISVMDEAASSVHHCEVKLRSPTKITTPYGGRLVWSLPGGTSLTVHLKDKNKIRHKKRWSQIMYMYYLLGYKLLGLENESSEKGSSKSGIHEKSRQYDQGSIFKYLPGNVGRKAHNTYILALDGDVDFKPDAVRLLMDGMTANPKCAAICGRIHPIGSGPVVWYQVFEYAVGHWLQKAAEAVYGCVLCCPGCFSLFRGSALMDDNIMRQYTVKAESLKELVQYDQGEDRWLSTLLIQQGYLVMYNAAADALTYAPETFHEFFNQRRRWVTSTLANVIDLLTSFKTTVARNDNISYLYMLYLFLMFIASVLTPGTVLLMVAGSYSAVLGTGMLHSFLLAFTPVLFFLVVCFTTKPDTHVIAAQLLGAVYSVVMTMVFVGNVVNAAIESISSPNVAFIILVGGLLILCGILHPEEIFCLVPGLLYVILVPTGLLILTLYSLSNMHIISWGTREMRTSKTIEELEKDAKDREVKRKEERLRKHERGFMNWLGVDGLLRDLKLFISSMTGRRSVEATNKIDILEQKVESLTNELHISKKQKRSNELQRRLLERTHEGEKTPHIKTEETQMAGTVPRDRKRNNPFWLGDEALKAGPTETLSNKETAFWRQLIHFHLHPLEKNAAKEKEVASQLRRMRTNVTFAYLMTNFLWIVTIFQLQLLKEALKDSFFITVPRADNPQEPLILEPLTLCFMFVFGLTLVIQFVATLIHRCLTFMHILARTELFGHRKNEYRNLLELADQLQSIHASRLDNEFEIPEPDYDDDGENETGTAREQSKTVHAAGTMRYHLSQRALPVPVHPRYTSTDTRCHHGNRFYRSRYLGPIHVQPDTLNRNFRRRFDYLRQHLRPRAGIGAAIQAEVARRRRVSIADIYRTLRGRGHHTHFHGVPPRRHYGYERDRFYI